MSGQHHLHSEKANYICPSLSKRSETGKKGEKQRVDDNDDDDNFVSFLELISRIHCGQTGVDPVSLSASFRSVLL